MRREPGSAPQRGAALRGLSDRAKLVLCLAILYLVWGGSYLVTSVGVHTLPPFLLGAVRFSISGLALYVIAQWLGEGRAPVTAVELRHVAITGFFTVLVSNGLNVWSMQWVPSNQAALLNVSSAFWITILGTLGRRGHPIGAGVAAGLAIGAAGVAMILWPGADGPEAPGAAALLGAQVPAYPLGSALLPQAGILLGCFGWALGTAYLRNVRTGLGLLSFTGLQMFAGGLMLMVPAALAGDFARWQWSTTGIAALAYLMVFNSLLAYTAYAWLSKHATPGQVGSYGLVNPAVATLLGWVVLGERLSALQWLGTLVILAGVLLVSRPGRPATEAA
jgi:drug/metabolite transporter (DMT)-like permease